MARGSNLSIYPFTPTVTGGKGLYLNNQITGHGRCSVNKIAINSREIKNMAWIYLLLAGLCEIGWPLGLKMIEYAPQHKYVYIALAVFSIAFSGYFLYMAQKTIPMGTAYAVWTGIGAVGAFVVGIILFKDSLSLMRVFSVTLIILGVIGLKLGS